MVPRPTTPTRESGALSSGLRERSARARTGRPGGRTAPRQRTLAASPRRWYVRQATGCPCPVRAPMSLTRDSSIEDVDRKYVFHPFTAPRLHEAGGGLMIVRGSGCTLWDTPRQRVPGRDGRPLVRQRRLRPPRDRRGGRRPDRAPLLLPRVLVDGDRHPGAARRARHRPRAGADGEGVLRQQRLGRQRHLRQAHLVLQERARAGPRRRSCSPATRGYHGVTVLSSGLTGLDGPPRRLRPAAADDPPHPGAAPAVGGGAGYERRRVRARASPTTSRR